MIQIQVLNGKINRVNGIFEVHQLAHQFADECTPKVWENKKDEAEKLLKEILGCKNDYYNQNIFDYIPDHLRLSTMQNLALLEIEIKKWEVRFRNEFYIPAVLENGVYTVDHGKVTLI